MPVPKIISFYTQDWEYPKHAQRLAAECDALGLEHRIECLPSTGSYLGNTCMKSDYVLRCLESEPGRPLLWIDVDGSILAYPRVLTDLQGADIAARRRRVVNEYGYTWHVGTLWFSGNQASRDFARAWSQHPTGTDEHKFQAWRGCENTLKVWQLPPEYFVILTQVNRHAIPTDTVIAHRISNSPIKRQEKAQSRAIRAAKRQQSTT